MNDLSPMERDQFLEEREKKHHSNRVLAFAFLAGVIATLVVLVVLHFAKTM